MFWGFWELCFISFFTINRCWNLCFFPFFLPDTFPRIPSPRAFAGSSRGVGFPGFVGRILSARRQFTFVHCSLVVLFTYPCTVPSLFPPAFFLVNLPLILPSHSCTFPSQILPQFSLVILSLPLLPRYFLPHLPSPFPPSSTPHSSSLSSSSLPSSSPPSSSTPSSSLPIMLTCILYLSRRAI